MDVMDVMGFSYSLCIEMHERYPISLSYVCIRPTIGKKPHIHHIHHADYPTTNPRFMPVAPSSGTRSRILDR
jgi:hypothetical protein